MQSDNPRISDLTRLFTAAAGTFAGMGREASEAARERFREALGGLDFVSREEFDAVKAMAAKAREENEALSARIAALEAKHASAGAATASPEPLKKGPIGKPADG
ncbi:accessory factor UbiK family protein [Croceicoccus marinus]|jgi:BMFP domain-containing protein YqiC|uniref:Accessory factor UbiK family protein n=1 Tax=Croceicoccus marinus TaxID=450378 RepID=A0A7G6VS99_9SPHN|nr:accessory factor UbiK family protein [Croceicoccus marinus]QNE04614.1 accessory factor UbiK family protein [Croceicoccus marinus]